LKGLTITGEFFLLCVGHGICLV